jgi:Uroporphyrinogen decarboxylase (URO-D)
VSTTDPSWAALTPDQKLRQRLDRWQDPDVEFASPEAEDAYRARVRRLADAILLEKTPDRVPVPLLVTELYPLARAGLTPYDGMYDFDAASEAYVRFNLDLRPDSMVSPRVATTPGRVFDLLDYRLYAWPGTGISREASFQYNEAEYMSAEEYDRLIEDPTDFILRRYLPRIAGAFAGLGGLGSALDPVGITQAMSFVESFARPEVVESLERIVAAGREAAMWRSRLTAVVGQLQSLGFPPFTGPQLRAPFDLLGDYLRGTRAVFLDLYRRPEKVIAACERLAPVLVRWTLEKTTPGTLPCLFGPLHKGDDAHMSIEQFETFYWPTLRTVLLALIDEGFVPLLFAEGRMDSRLERIAADLPKGRTVWLLDRTDMAHAKATLGQVAALQGNVPLSLLQTATPAEVTDYCRRLIEVAAPGGGFLLDSGGAMQQGKEENIRAMIQAALDHGVY